MSRSKQMTTAEANQKGLASMKKSTVDLSAPIERGIENGLLEALLSMSDVQRLSGTPILQSYSLSHHCFNVGNLFIEVCKAECVGITLGMVTWVLRHDLLETLTGDLLWPAKNLNAKTKKAWDTVEEEVAKHVDNAFMTSYTDNEGEEILGKTAWKIFQACDMLDLYLFCVKETDLGNATRKMKKVLSVTRTKLCESGIQSVMRLVY